MVIVSWWPCVPGPLLQEYHVLPRLGKFLLVGGIGVLVNTVALYLLYQQAQLHLALASAISIEVAIANNFIWNDRWTFGQARLAFARFARFNLVSLGGLVIAAATLWALATYLGLHYLFANLLGAVVATAWNVAVNFRWTWGKS